MENPKTDKKRLVLSMVFPLLFIVLLWCIKVIEVVFEVSFSSYGLYPLQSKGLIGIITGPLIHGDWKHLFNNSLPLFFLS